MSGTSWDIFILDFKFSGDRHEFLINFHKLAYFVIWTVGSLGDATQRYFKKSNFTGAFLLMTNKRAWVMTLLKIWHETCIHTL